MVRDNQYMSFLVLSGVGFYSALLVGAFLAIRAIWFATPAIGY